jgi:hypothetical protein
MKRSCATLLSLLFLLVSSLAVHAQAVPQTAVNFKDVSIFYEFGKEIIFQTTLDPGDQIQEAFLFIQPEGQNSRKEKIEANENGEVIFTYDAAAAPLRPFANTAYWFQVTLTDESTVESQRYAFFYEDNRFNWQQLEKDGFQINWQSKDAGFGQVVLDIAVQSLAIARNYVPAQPPELLKIYVYENASDVQTSLNLGQFKSWVAGHASPDLATVLISAPAGPSQQLELERQIPHEITHILQYQLMGANYRNAPMWLLEGTASLSELYPNPDYQRVLERAVAEESLIPLQELCAFFPSEASRAFLAYAQSESFSRFLFTTYGSSGLKSLMENYQNGQGCMEGFSSTFKRSLKQEEYRWQQQLGIHTGQLVVQNIAPYFTVLALMMVPAALSGLKTRTKPRARKE